MTNIVNKISKFEMTGDEDEDLDKLLARINNGEDVNVRDKDGVTALMVASSCNYTDICKLLIANGADINIQSDDGNTPLILASDYGCIDICRLLIENGADINIQNKEGETALMYASIHRNTEICKLLIDNGADINIKSIYGDTALIWGSRRKNIDMCKLLIEDGADINIKNNSGYTPIDLMKNNGIYEALKPIINRIEGLKYFKEVFMEHAESYMDIFETTLYSQDLELDDIKANIDMFYSTIVARMDNNAINENVEL